MVLSTFVCRQKIIENKAILTIDFEEAAFSTITLADVFGLYAQNSSCVSPQTYWFLKKLKLLSGDEIICTVSPD